MKNNRA